jgi:predicted Rossmann fold nucleotide-binding protein DprA/Smf involved in DNA uptake
LLAKLREEALTADELVRASGISPSHSSAALMELELAGHVTIEDGVYRVAL